MYLIAFIVFVFILTFGYASWRGAPWIPTKADDVKRFLKIADIKPNQKVYDLGCGDGRLVAAAAKEGAKAEGFEISLLPYFLSKLRLFFLNDNKAKIRYKDFWHSNLSDADIVYFFLMPKAYPKLKIKFENELKKGAKVISYVWPIKGWEPITVDIVSQKPKIYIYKI